MLFSSSAGGGRESRRPKSTSSKRLNLESLESRAMFSVSQLLAGDADCDDTVGFSDFLSLSKNFGADESDWSDGDFDGDGSVGFPDFLILSKNFGNTAPPNYVLPLTALEVDEAIKVPVEAGGRDLSTIEIEVDAPQLLDYSISLRAASPVGTQIEVQMVDELGDLTLATIEVPNTGSLAEYTDTQDVTISLPEGVHTLRFEDLDVGVNIDQITFSAGDASDVVVSQPTANDGPDINPMKGFNSGWWRNEETASVGFQYIEWRHLEPQDDFFDWEYIENEILSRPGTQDRHFVLQFVVDWAYDDSQPDYRGPQWLLDQVGEVTGTEDPDDPDSQQLRATRYNEELFIEEASEAIKALLDHYRDDPRNYVIQVGALGFWGEWHTFPRNEWAPTEDTKQAILDAYLDNLGDDGLTQVRYPKDPINVPRAGVGYTNGSATLTDHGSEPFGKYIEENELWKNGPVGGEWPPGIDDPEIWERFFETDEGLSFLNEGHYSTMLPPEIDSDNPWIQDIVGVLGEDFDPSGHYMDMHRQMGYNFQANAVRHLVSADDSGQTHIEVDLHNAGIAPFYKNWDVQLAILDGETGEVVEHIDIDTDIRTLGPTETTTIAGSINAGLDPDGQYQVGLRILQPGADKTKATAWKLDARNVYVALANDVEVVEGKWENRVLQGGWNVLDDIERPSA